MASYKSADTVYATKGNVAFPGTQIDANRAELKAKQDIVTELDSRVTAETLTANSIKVAGAAVSSGSVYAAIVFTVAADITGTEQEGETLTATSTITGTPTGNKTYQWQVSDDDAVADPYEDIAGATAATYVPLAGHVTKYLRVVVTANNEVNQVSSTSPPTAAIIGA